jgi:DNA-binding CsgD family transcriptional regulator/PAS domain-containing protein
MHAILHPMHAGRQLAKAGISLADYDLVVSRIYDAALAPSVWEDALAQLVDRFAPAGWDNAMLLWERIDPPAGRFVGSSGVHAMARQGYLHAFAGNNPWSLAGHDIKLGAVLHSDRLVPRSALIESDFYKHFLGNFQFDAGVLSLLDRQGSDHLGLCLPGPHREPTIQLEAALRLLVPHLQRAVRISRRIGEAELSAASSRAVLDATGSAVVLCDGDLNAGYLNPAAERLVESGLLTLVHGQLRFADPAIAAKLVALADPLAGRRCRAFLIEHPGETPVAVMAVRIDLGQAAAAVSGAQLMLVANRNHVSLPESVERLREIYQLTPAEARLAATLAEGASLDDFIATRGISMNSAKFLLKAVFAKTSTNRQGALIAQLRSLPLEWQAAEPNKGLPAPI